MHLSTSRPTLAAALWAALLPADGSPWLRRVSFDEVQPQNSFWTQRASAPEPTPAASDTPRP